jgi:hypothetical protein
MGDDESYKMSLKVEVEQLHVHDQKGRKLIKDISLSLSMSFIGFSPDFEGFDASLSTAELLKPDSGITGIKSAKASKMSKSTAFPTRQPMSGGDSLLTVQADGIHVDAK